VEPVQGVVLHPNRPVFEAGDLLFDEVAHTVVVVVRDGGFGSGLNDLPELAQLVIDKEMGVRHPLAGAPRLARQRSGREEE
jgi:hypothetical protein